MPKTKWYPQYVTHHSGVTFRYDETFPVVAGQTCCVRRFQRESGSWFYVPHNWTDGRGSVVRLRSLAAVVHWLEQAIGRGEVPCS